jgi:hypothetical protein
VGTSVFSTIAGSAAGAVIGVLGTLAAGRSLRRHERTRATREETLAAGQRVIEATAAFAQSCIELDAHVADRRPDPPHLPVRTSVAEFGVACSLLRAVAPQMADPVEDIRRTGGTYARLAAKGEAGGFEPDMIAARRRFEQALGRCLEGRRSRSG